MKTKIMKLLPAGFSGYGERPSSGGGGGGGGGGEMLLGVGESWDHYGSSKQT